MDLQRPPMDISHDAELEMIRRVLTGERDLFYNLIQPYERRVYAALLSMLRIPADAEDAAQEAMLKAYRSLHMFRGEAKFGTWLTTIALNEGRSRLAAAARRQEKSLEEEVQQHGGDFTPAVLTDRRPVPTEVLERAELASRINSAVAALPSTYREVFTLRDVEEYGVDEVAELLHVTSNVVRVRLHRARAMLQKQLAPVLTDYATPPKRSRVGALP